MGVKLGQGKPVSKGGGGNTSAIEINLSKLNDGESVRVRLVGEVEPAYRYWVKCDNGKQKPIITPYFNRETEVLSSQDPLLGVGRKEFFYTINAIDRATGEMKVLLLKTSVYRTLMSFAQDEEYGDPSDPDNGYDIVITKESTGPLAMNVKYEVKAGRNTTPLTEEEKNMELHNLAQLYAAPSESEYIEWIKMNTSVLNVPTDNSEVNIEPEEDIPF